MRLVGGTSSPNMENLVVDYAERGLLAQNHVSLQSHLAVLSIEFEREPVGFCMS